MKTLRKVNIKVYIKFLQIFLTSARDYIVEIKLDFAAITTIFTTLIPHACAIRPSKLIRSKSIAIMNVLVTRLLAHIIN